MMSSLQYYTQYFTSNQRVGGLSERGTRSSHVVTASRGSACGAYMDNAPREGSDEVEKRAESERKIAVAT